MLIGSSIHVGTHDQNIRDFARGVELTSGPYRPVRWGSGIVLVTLWWSGHRVVVSGSLDWTAQLATVIPVILLMAVFNAFSELG